jgi:hypothetical protein
LGTLSSGIIRLVTTAIACKGLLFNVKQAIYAHSEIYGL